MIGIVISKRLATLKEIHEYYGMEDILNMVEVTTIDAFNEHLANKENAA